MPTNESRRVMRWQKKHRRQVRATRTRYWKKVRAAANDARREKNFRFAWSSRRTHNYRPFREASFAVVTADQLKKPMLTFIDARGRVWHEDFRSAEQLIKEWNREKRKKAHSP